MADELEIPQTAEQLYRARGHGEISPHRPLLQGDVFVDTPIPGVDEDSALAIITTHACDMRGNDGVSLASAFHVARVSQRQDAPHLRGWFKYFPSEMPLPDLRGAGNGHFTAHLEFVGRTRTEDLGARIACLDNYGITILQQRLAHKATRVVISKDTFMQQSAAIFEEADLLEEWIEASHAAGHPRGDAEREFHELIRANRGQEPPLQAQLRDAEKRSHVRQVVRLEIQKRFSERVLHPAYPATESPPR
jgi:hypothetical protein